MLRSVKSIEKFAVHADDGRIGAVADLFFDDERWVVRYVVVDTGGWLTGRQVLLSPISFSQADWDGKALHARLSRERIESSPGIESHQPVSRRQEAALYRHYGYPYYWGGPYTWGHALLPNLMEQQVFEDPQRVEIRKDMEEAGKEDRHLRSCNEVAGYTIAASDGDLGHVVDFLMDEEDWSIQYLVIDPRNYWPGKHVLVPAARIEHVLWAEQEVAVDLRREEVERSPEYDPGHLPPSPRQQAARPQGTTAARPGA
jgi:uncharacterized protein YrrD